MEQAVALMIGTTAVVAGISFLLHGKDWAGWLHMLRSHGRPAALMMGYFHLLVGTFIVGFHWQWSGLPLLLTLLGVKAILEGMVYTLCPNCLIFMLGWYKARERILFPIAGIVTIVIGLAVLCEWWQYMHSVSCVWHPCFNQALLEE